jgi:hypothetical protein
MKILLLGEYSGVHTNLAKALREDNHEVTLIHDGDSFKGFKADYILDYKKFSVKNKFLNIFIRLYYLILLLTGIRGVFQIFRHKKILLSLKGYDVVQLINPVYLNGYGALVNLIYFFYLKKNNRKVFLCALGDDYIYCRYALDGNLKYSMYDNLKVKNIRYFLHASMHLWGLGYKSLNLIIAKRVNGIIPGLYDYYKAYSRFSNVTNIVPIIVSIDNDIKPIDIKEYPINIFHGWQPKRHLHKGNHLFDQAVKKLIAKYPGKINYKIVSGVPYDKYIKLFEDSHVFLDQCYSYDCGVNALLAMAKGKVVFSGFEDEVKDYYKLNSLPIINALPNVEKILLQLENIINNIDILPLYSVNSINFILLEHSKSKILAKYKKIWNN